MLTQSVVVRYQSHVCDEYDVVKIRQHVREVARSVGLGLAGQAKLAAAISAVARALIRDQHSATFTVQTTGEKAQGALEVVCTMPMLDYRDGTALLGALGLTDMGRLLDEAAIAETSDMVMLTLRMRLMHQPLDATSF